MSLIDQFTEHVLIVDDEMASKIAGIIPSIDGQKLNLLTAKTAIDALELIESSVRIGVVILDIRIPYRNANDPADFNGLDLVGKFLSKDPDTVVIVLTANDDPEYRKIASERNVFAFVGKVVAGRKLPERLIPVVRNAILHRVFSNKCIACEKNTVGDKTEQTFSSIIDDMASPLDPSSYALYVGDELSELIDQETPNLELKSIDEINMDYVADFRRNPRITFGEIDGESPTTWIMDSEVPTQNAHLNVPLVVDGSLLGLLVLGFEQLKFQPKIVANRYRRYVESMSSRLLLRSFRILAKRSKALNQQMIQKSEIGSPNEMVGKSPAFVECKEKAEQYATSKHAVLIQGECGTGKELIAQHIHIKSGRKGILLAESCAVLKPELIESTLFGHEKGTFTDATDTRIGLIEAAHEGTLFLDEIGELPMELQAKLLRVLEKQEFLRTGSTTVTKVNVRFVFATNRNLKEMVEDGSFRKDLFYRINVLSIETPALSKRVSDIPDLAHHFLELSMASEQKSIKFDPADLEILKEHDWPGNIRELKNIITNCVVLQPDGGRLTPDFIRSLLPKYSPTVEPSMNIKELVKKCRKAGKPSESSDEIRNLLQKIYEDAEGNITLFAAKAGMTRYTAYKYLKEFSVVLKK